MNEIEHIPTSYTLHQNYPNPFSPGTTISFDLSAASHVNLKVYTVLGKEVATLLDEQKEAGRHAVHFDGSGLSSGTYFVRLQAGASAETRTLLLLKVSARMRYA